MVSKRIRIGCATGLATPPTEVASVAKYIEAAGFDSVWVGEPPGFRHGSGALVAAAQATSTLPLGFALTNPYTRHATVNAMLAATVDDLCRQRFTLVFGAGSLEFLRRIGLDWVRPVQHLREAIQVCRALWQGEPVTFEGATVSLKQFK